LLGLIFDPENWGNTFIRNVVGCLPDYMSFLPEDITQLLL
jgi:hypothetical protein